jgi:phosphopantothenoylcysteine decarboxylase/phosphopantothenate--cysteine ligase
MEQAATADAVVASAAVADFRPAEVGAGKIKKGAMPEAITLVRNPDILAELGERDLGGVRIGFAAETSDVERHAREKLLSKHCHMVVANDVSDPALGFGTESNRVLFVTPDGTTDSGVIHKRAIAREVCDRLARLLDGESSA